MQDVMVWLLILGGVYFVMGEYIYRYVSINGEDSRWYSCLVLGYFQSLYFCL